MNIAEALVFPMTFDVIKWRFIARDMRITKAQQVSTHTTYMMLLWESMDSCPIGWPVRPTI
jgi:hypothetical protein